MYNFLPTIIEEIEQRTGLHIQQEQDKERIEEGFLGTDLIDYIYAILHSKRYRNTYHTFLQNDFPIIPYPVSGDYFLPMAA